MKSKSYDGLAAKGLLKFLNDSFPCKIGYYNFGGGSGIIGSLLFIIPLIFFRVIHYSLFNFARYSLFRFEFVEQLWLHRRCNSINFVFKSSPKIDQSMFTVETVVSQTELFFLSYEKNISIAQT